MCVFLPSSNLVKKFAKSMVFNMLSFFKKGYQSFLEQKPRAKSSKELSPQRSIFYAIYLLEAIQVSSVLLELVMLAIPRMHYLYQYI
jgi:hypothetical protein